MTQSDAPNEGREQAEKYAKSEWDKDHRQDVRPLIKGYLAGYNSLRDQLSKERETVTDYRKQVEILDCLRVNEKEINNSWRQQLEKEREMRKELVDTLKEIYEYITDEGILEDLVGVEELIERASDLDKNKG